MALNNDTTDVGVLFSLLRIANVTTDTQTVDLSAVTGDRVIPLDHGTLTVNVLNAKYDHFTYVPNLNFTGQETFKYQVSDGTLLSAAPGATATITIQPVSDVGSDTGSGVGYTIYEGGQDFYTHDNFVHLDGSNSRGPGLQYFWYIDTNPNADPFGGSYAPDPSDLVTTVGGSPVDPSSSALDLTWDDLNDNGIVDGNIDAVVSLKVVDSNGNERLSSGFLSVLNVAPFISNFTVTPASSGGCGSMDYIVSATVTEENPLDNDFSVSFFGDALGSEPTDPLVLQQTAVGTFTVSVPYTYTSTGLKIPMLQVDVNGLNGADPLELSSMFLGDLSDPDYDLFTDGAITVGGGGSPGTPTAAINGAPASGPEGTVISLTSAVTHPCAVGVDYLWSVTKDGNPFASATTADFSFTPDDNASYVVNLTVTNSGGSASDTKTIAVTNVPPILTLSGTATADEGTSYTLNLSSSDPGADTIDHWTITWGDGTQTVAGNPASVTHVYPEGPDSYSISATATDEDGTFAASNTAAVTVSNVAPSQIVLNSGAVNEGGAFTLSGSFADPGLQDAHTVVIAWGPGEGSTTLNLAAGVLSFTASHPYADDNPTGTSSDVYSVAVTVTDDDGQSDSATTNVTVSNIAPVIGTLTATSTTAGAATVTVSGLLSDLGINDSQSVSIVWEAGGTPQTVAVTGSAGAYTFTATHTYTSTGLKSITATATDDDTGSGTAAASITVQAAQNGGTVQVLGSTAADTINITSGAGGAIQVQANFLGAVTTFAGADTLQLTLGDGNDVVIVAPNVTKTILVFGGDGNDILTAGGGPAVLVGGAGNDALFGGGARNILIGGAGSDILSGSAGQDILVDSGITFDTNGVALLAMLAEWNSSHSLQDRVKNLINGSGSVAGLNNGYFLTTTGNDLAVDLLIGGGSTDWILLHAGDLSLGTGDIINHL